MSFEAKLKQLQNLKKANDSRLVDTLAIRNIEGSYLDVKNTTDSDNRDKDTVQIHSFIGSIDVKDGA